MCFLACWANSWLDASGVPGNYVRIQTNVNAGQRELATKSEQVRRKIAADERLGGGITA
jgi:hypothetical protein